MRYACIRDHRTEYPVRMMCRLLEVSRSGFYGWMRRPESRRSREDRRLLVEVRGIHQATRGSYGSPRIVRELRGLGYSYGRKRVARVMRAHGIVGKHRRKFHHTTDSDHGRPVAENLLATVERPTAPDRVWVADITYLWTREGWLYVAGVMDLATRRIVGWATSGRGNRYDNAAMESFFGSMKVEWTFGRRCETRAEAERDVLEYIEVFYNRARRHSSRGYVSP